MKIVVLDGNTLNPGDLSWEGLNDFGEWKVYERTNPEELIHRSESADILLPTKWFLTPKQLFH